MNLPHHHTLCHSKDFGYLHLEYAASSRLLSIFFLAIVTALPKSSHSKSTNSTQEAKIIQDTFSDSTPAEYSKEVEDYLRKLFEEKNGHYASGIGASGVSGFPRMTQNSSSTAHVKRAAPTPSCDYQTPKFAGASGSCLCEGSSLLPLITADPALPAQASCAYTTLPGVPMERLKRAPLTPQTTAAAKPSPK